MTMMRRQFYRWPFLGRSAQNLFRPALALGIMYGASGSSPAAPARGQLDLSQYHLTFDDEFTKLDISANGPGTTWTAHTPWHGDFGDAVFANPGPDTPFSIIPRGGLAITARKSATGHWSSGLICSVDIDGPGQTGFRQKYGYFEIDTKLPPGPGTWPAFWLIGTDKSKAASEIDIFEYYGKFPGYFRSTEHLWSLHGKDTLNVFHVSEVTPGSLINNFNRFGVSIDPHEMRYYLNGREFWSTPTPPAYNQPMYILANLALGGGWPISGLASPAVMQIRYIRVYQFNHLPSDK
jgi:hypothetical protein